MGPTFDDATRTPRRARPEHCVEQLLASLARTLGNDLDPPVGKIAGRPSQPQGQGPPAHPPAKADALHPPADARGQSYLLGHAGTLAA